MTAAYDRMYLDDAMDCFGEALDYAANACGMDVSLFLDMFLAGGFDKRFEDGDCSVVAGMSGTELVRRVMLGCNVEIAFPDAEQAFSEISYEYLCGELLAYVQWYSGRTFHNILRYVTIESLQKYVEEFAKGDEDKRNEIADSLIESFDEPVYIQEMRKRCGFSQRQLSDIAEVNIRTLQQYEIKSKDINKAAAVTVNNLARKMGCAPEDIMEYDK